MMVGLFLVMDKDELLAFYSWNQASNLSTDKDLISQSYLAETYA